MAAAERELADLGVPVLSSPRLAVNHLAGREEDPTGSAAAGTRPLFS
jgi:hypothetical protein